MPRARAIPHRERMTNNKAIVNATTTRHIAPATVNRHLENVYAKIGVTTRAAATVWALEHGYEV